MNDVRNFNNLPCQPHAGRRRATRLQYAATLTFLAAGGHIQAALLTLSARLALTPASVFRYFVRHNSIQCWHVVNTGFLQR